MANVIFRGPVRSQPRTLNLPVTGAYLPGILVTASASALTMATAADNGKKLLVLSNAEFTGQAIDAAYTAGDTGVGYEPQPGETYQVKLAAASYALGDPLAIGADGYLTAAASGGVVFARFDGTPGAFAAGDLADVEIANSYVMA